MDSTKRFGDFVRKARKKKGYSVDKLAECSGLSNAQISRIERGVGGTPKVDTVKKLAVGLEIAPTDLLTAVDLLNKVDMDTERLNKLKELKGKYDESELIIAATKNAIANRNQEIAAFKSFIENPTTELTEFIELPFITYNGLELSNTQREKIRLMLEVLMLNDSQEKEES